MRQKRRIIPTLLIMMCVFFANSNLVYSEYYDPVDVGDYPNPAPDPTERPVSNPRVKLTSPTMITAKSGQTVDVDLVVKNVGSSYANNFLTQASAGGESPFVLQFLNNSNIISNIYSGSSRTIRLQVKVDKDAKAGSYSITLNHSYKNAYDENFSETDNLVVKVENVSSAPNVIMHTIQSEKNVVSPSDKFQITAVIENASTFEAQDVQVQIDGLDANAIYMSGSSDNVYYKTFSARTQNKVTFDFSTFQKAKKGTYPLTFRIKYKDSANAALENSYIYYVTVGGASSENEERAQVELRNMQAPDATFGVGQQLTINLDIVNVGVSAAKNVKITAGSDSEGAVVPRSSSVQVINSLAVGETKSLSFSFAPTAKSISQNYPVSFKVEYETGAESDEGKPEILAFEQYAGINVTNPEADEKEEKEEDDKKISKPKIIVSSYTADPIIVKAGKEFDLYMTFMNTHSNKRINNIKATLTAVETTEKKGSVFSPVNGSNTFFIDEIAPKGTADKEFRMFTVPDAEPRNYSILVHFKYQDDEFNEYEEEELIGITVKQVTKFETSKIEIPSNATLGQPIYLSFSINNTGKVALSNLKVDIDGNFDVAGGSTFLGNIKAGSSMYFDSSFTPMEAGRLPGKVVVSCEDDTGEPMELVQEFTVEVIEMQFNDDWSSMEMMAPAEEPSLLDKIPGVLKNPFVYVGIAAAIVIIVMLARKFRSKKKELDFDE